MSKYGSIEAFSVTLTTAISNQSTEYTNLGLGTGLTTTPQGNTVFDVVAIGGVYTIIYERCKCPIGIGTFPVSGNPNHIGLGWIAPIDKFIETSPITN